MTGRRSRNWARPVDDGDAAAALHEIELWRATQAGPPKDWDGLMRRIRDRLALLWASPVVRDDPACRAIVEGMVSCRDMEAFAAEITRLQTRVGEIVAARQPTPPTRHPEPGAARAGRRILNL